MDDDLIEFKLDLMFGQIELHPAPPRIIGNDLYPRYRVIERDGKGNVTRDETLESGCCLVNGAPYKHLFGESTKREG